MQKSKKLPVVIPQQPKKQEIRWSIDRLWNIAFALSMTIGVLTIGIWAVPVVIIALKYFNPIKFRKEDKKFITDNGRVIDPKKDFPHPVALFFAPWLTIAGCVLLTFVTGSMFFGAKWIMLFFLVIYPVVLFSYKNCPITILFTLKAWSFQIIPCDQRCNRSSFDRWEATDPAKSYLPHNIYHHRRHRR